MMLASLIIFVPAIVACMNEGTPIPISENKTNAGEFQVQLLFEVDSIRVYRFYDQGHFHYFTNKKGVSLNGYSKQVGKHRRTEYEEIENN